MRIVFFGSPEVAVGPLEALVEAGHEVVLVVTGPDRRRGRGSRTTPTPVKAAAEALGIPVVHDMEKVTEVDARLGVVVAYGRLIPTTIIDRMPLVNIHFSLLPRWRGAAPVERAILAGDTTTGVCLMEVVQQLDGGGVYVREEVEIGTDETAPELTERLGEIGTRLLVELLEGDLPVPTPQNEDQATYAHKMTADDRELTADLAAEDFLRRVRVGGAWTTVAGRRIKVLGASRRPGDPPGVPGDDVGSGVTAGSLIEGPGVQLVDGVVDLVTVQPAGRSEMSASDWVRGSDVIGGRIGT